MKKTFLHLNRLLFPAFGWSTLGGIICYLLFTAPTVNASCNLHASMTTSTKDLTNWTTTCTIATNTIEGIDKTTLETGTTNAAALTLSSGGSITINAGGELIVGSLNLNGGSIAIQDNGENSGTIKIGAPLYVTDADADGWPTNFTLYDATTSGRRRLALMRDFSTNDCNDIADYRINNTCCTIGTYYADADGDGYGAGDSSQRCPTAGYVTNNTDCYDSNANAHPNSTYCSTTNRGDGS